MYLIRILGFSLGLSFMGCVFADFHRKPNAFSKEKAGFLVGKSITLLNDNRMFYQKGFHSYVEYLPPFGEDPHTYFPKKQREIGETRYKWKYADIYNIHDKDFEFSKVKTDHVLLISVHPPEDERIYNNFYQVVQLLSFCLFPCKFEIKLDTSIQYYYKNKWIAESKFRSESQQSLSPIYLFVPTRFDIELGAQHTTENHLFSILFLEGFQNAMDELVLKLSEENHIIPFRR